MPKKIKLFWWTGALLVVLTVVGIAGAVMCQRTEVSDLYRHYRDNPHLSVTFLRNFPVNDTLTVDVTILAALDSTGWDTLKADFNIKPLPDIVQKEIDNGRDIITCFMVPKENPSLPMDTLNLLNNNPVGVSQLHRTISIFNTETEAQIDAVNHYNYRL